MLKCPFKIPGTYTKVICRILKGQCFRWINCLSCCLLSSAGLLPYCIPSIPTTNAICSWLRSGRTATTTSMVRNKNFCVGCVIERGVVRRIPSIQTTNAICSWLRSGRTATTTSMVRNKNKWLYLGVCDWGV